MDIMNLLLSGAGGAVIGPLISQLAGGGQSSLLIRLVTGVVGGLGAGAGAGAAGIDLASLLGGGGLGSVLAPLLEGGVGGGLLSTIVGMAANKKG